MGDAMQPLSQWRDRYERWVGGHRTGQHPEMYPDHSYA